VDGLSSSSKGQEGFLSFRCFPCLRLLYYNDRSTQQACMLMEFWELEIPVTSTCWVTRKALVGLEAHKLALHFSAFSCTVDYYFNIET
jgi:hypothetical protein